MGTCTWKSSCGGLQDVGKGSPMKEFTIEGSRARTQAEYDQLVEEQAARALLVGCTYMPTSHLFGRLAEPTVVNGGVLTYTVICPDTLKVTNMLPKNFSGAGMADRVACVRAWHKYGANYEHYKDFAMWWSYDALWPFNSE